MHTLRPLLFAALLGLAPAPPAFAQSLPSDAEEDLGLPRNRVYPPHIYQELMRRHRQLETSENRRRSYYDDSRRYRGERYYDDDDYRGRRRYRGDYPSRYRYD